MTERERIAKIFGQSEAYLPTNTVKVKGRVFTSLALKNVSAKIYSFHANSAC